MVILQCRFTSIRNVAQTSQMRKHRPFADGSANAPNRPEGDLQRWPDERAVSARKRSSAEGMGWPEVAFGKRAANASGRPEAGGRANQNGLRLAHKLPEAGVLRIPQIAEPRMVNAGN